MALGKPKKKITPDEVAVLFLMFSHDIVMNARQDLETRLVVQKRSELDKVAEELMFFCFFALDYWISNHISARKERRTVREALSNHWRQMLGCDDKGQTMLRALQERLKDYGQTVNEEQSDQAKFLGLGIKLSEFCGFPGNPYLLVLAPDFFTAAMDAVYKIEWHKVVRNTELPKK